MFARCPQRGDVPGLLIVERRVDQQIGHADHPVERRPHFMAHHGQERRPGPRCCLGLVACAGECLLRQDTLGNIGVGPDNAATR